MTTYTVFAPSNPNEIIGRGLTAQGAMDAILTYDGYDYEIRQTETGGWRLYHSDGSRYSTRGARRMQSTMIASVSDQEHEARKEIALELIAAAWNTKPGHPWPEVMTDEAYDQMRREFEADMALDS